jgi:hypothetical protein
LAQIKPYKPRRRRLSYGDTIYDPKDGLNINNIKWGWYISSLKHQMSIFDSSDVYVRLGNRMHKQVGVMNRVGNVNRYKSLNLNSQIGQLNRKVYNVR